MDGISIGGTYASRPGGFGTKSPQLAEFELSAEKTSPQSPDTVRVERRIVAQ